MSNYSLIIVTKTHPDNSIDGYWIQDKNGTLKEAKERAVLLSEVNKGNDIAIVDQVSNTNPLLDYFTNLKRL